MVKPNSRSIDNSDEHVHTSPRSPQFGALSLLKSTMPQNDSTSHPHSSCPIPLGPMAIEEDTNGEVTVSLTRPSRPHILFEPTTDSDTDDRNDELTIGLDSTYHPPVNHRIPFDPTTDTDDGIQDEPPFSIVHVHYGNQPPATVASGGGKVVSTARARGKGLMSSVTAWANLLRDKFLEDLSTLADESRYPRLGLLKATQLNLSDPAGIEKEKCEDGHRKQGDYIKEIVTPAWYAFKHEHDLAGDLDEQLSNLRAEMVKTDLEDMKQATEGAGLSRLMAAEQDGMLKRVSELFLLLLVALLLNSPSGTVYWGSNNPSLLPPHAHDRIRPMDVVSFDRTWLFDRLALIPISDIPPDLRRLEMIMRSHLEPPPRSQVKDFSVYMWPTNGPYDELIRRIAKWVIEDGGSRVSVGRSSTQRADETFGYRKDHWCLVLELQLDAPQYLWK
ncbi:hypothetical protein BS47DRAFT_1395812 [Hydnum rufescens UP504]|uniref:Uncharacterized protein n=1 Tax=Hydnum rufescens UP504 TaxID=1448309 RepID=A0A9P6ARG3_9AGAM|nr:hypothetical protein BS47DRAFT_1395812 [Hydnum rufescens UP504]